MYSDNMIKQKTAFFTSLTESIAEDTKHEEVHAFDFIIKSKILIMLVIRLLFTASMSHFLILFDIRIIVN